MAPLESFNKLPETPVKKPTGVSETSKEYQNPLNNINEINQREKIDKSISEIWLSKEETEEIINTIISKFWNYTKTIDSILETISKDISIDSKDRVMGVILKAEEAKVDTEVQSNVQEVQSNVQEVQSNVQEVQTWIEQKYEIVKNILKTIDWENSKDYSQILDALNNWEKFEKIIPMLKSNPVALRWLALDLQKQNPKQFEVFRDTLISIDKDFIQIFDKIQFETIDNTAKLKLWTNNLNWVDLNSNTLRKKEWDITTTYSKENWRSLSVWDFKLKSDLNPNNETQFVELNKNTENQLNPINESLSVISNLLDFIDKSKQQWVDFLDLKKQIKEQNILLYNELWLENKTSYDEFLFAITSKKQELEKNKEEIIKKHKKLANELILKNTKEASEKDEAVKQLLKFLESIWFTFINQAKLQTILDFININPQTYWLDEKIDLENGVLWFNRDFWDRNINASEKKAFIKLFNRMLWENIIDENISTGITTLSPQAILKMQVLSNKTTWFFMENLGKREETK